MVTWQGARVWRLGLSSFLISGALAGLAGVIEVLGPERPAGQRLPADAWLHRDPDRARRQPVGRRHGFVSLFFGGLASAALYLPVMAGLPSAAIDIINAAIALFITAKSEWVDRLLRLGNAPS